MRRVGLCALLWLATLSQIACSSNGAQPVPTIAQGASSGSGANAGTSAGGSGAATQSDATPAGGSATSGGAGGSIGAAGGSGGVAGGGAGGNAGSRGSLDAGDDVTFDWPETVPGTGGCKAGKYTGQFTCTYTDPSGTSSLAVNGPITLTLAEAEGGEIFEVRDGLLDGTANTFFSIRADITGKLDCVLGTFQGTLVNGTYSGFLIVNGSFTGELASQYDHTSYALVQGTWNLAVVGGPGGTCVGAWSANYAGP